MSGDTPTYQLDCACCGDDVFTRDDDVFTDGETEHCRCCGSRVSVSADSEGVYGTTVDEDAGPIVARLLVESTVLASLVEALEDSARPEESPVDAVRRLRAEVARLTPDTPGAVSDHVRSRFAEASAATLAGEGGCIGAGCLPAHQACEVLDAYDDARAEVERLTEQEGDDAHERLRKIAEPIQREVCERRARDHSPRYGSNEAVAKRARAIAKAEGWDCYPEDSTTDEPAPVEPDNPEVAWSALRIAAARLGSVTVRGVDVDLHAAVDMALGEARGEPGGDE